MIVVIARLVIKPGSIPHLVGPAKVMIAQTRKETGCIAYDLYSSITEPETMIFLERWETREALSAHARTAHVATWREASNPHLVSRTVEIVHPEKVETF